MLKPSKYSKIALPLALVSTLALAQEEKKDWRQKLQEGMSKAKETTQEYKEKATDSYQRYKQETSERFRESQQQYQQGMQDLGQRTREGYQSFQQYNQSLRNSDLGRVVNDSLREIASNPSKIYDVKRAMENSALNATINIVKDTKVYDPNDGQLKTVDDLLTESLKSSGLPLPPEIVGDPVKAAFLLSIDRGYLLDAKLIKDGNNWISLKEIKEKKSLPEIEDAISQYFNMGKSLRSQNYQMLDSSTRNFMSDIEKINATNNSIKFPWSGTELAFLEENPVYRSVDSINAHFIPRKKWIDGSDYPISEDAREKINWTIIGLLGLGGAVAVSKIGKKIKQGKKPQPSPVIYKQGSPKRTLRY